MYKEVITTQEEALAHLFFHCCFKDELATEEEVNAISEKLVRVGLNTELNFKDEVVKYKSYAPQIEEEEEYLQFLVKLILPVNNLSLFSHCAELCLSDADLSAEEDLLLDKIARVLDVEEDEKKVIKKLVLQHKVVESQKFF